MQTATIYADFNNTDSQGRLRLNCVGTVEDLSREGIDLQEGMLLSLHDEELEAEGEAHFSADEQIWVATIDWKMVQRLRNESKT